VVEDIAREMEEQKLRERAEAVDWIKDIHDISEQLRPLERAMKQARDLLKRYMELNRDDLETDDRGNPLLYNGEIDETWILRGSTRHGYDLVSLAESHPEVVVAAAKQGWLSADHASVEKHPGASWVDIFKRAHMPTSGSESLIKKE